MYRFLLLCMTVVTPFVWSDSIINHLDTATHHEKPTANYLDAAFVIRLYEDKDLSPLIDALKLVGISVVEYNNFNSLSMKTMSQFCSSIISPYLLTQILSHLSIYKYCLDHDLKQVLIMEDQAALKGNMNHIATILTKMDLLKAPWDILYTDIDYHHPRTGEAIVPHVAEFPRNRQRVNPLFSKVFCRYGTVSYIISETGMRKILRYFEHHWNNLPYDQVLFKIPSLRIFGPHQDAITNHYSREKLAVKTPEKIQRKQNTYTIGEEFWIDPKQLLSFDRMDIIPKYIYAKYQVNHYNTSWHIDMYRSHLEKWVQCYNTRPLKIGFKDFKDAFDSLIESMQTRGFNTEYTLGINRQNIPWNGAHRTGTCIALGIPIKVKVMENRPSQDITMDAFRNAYHLEEDYLDHMALEYAKLNKNTFVVCLYPGAYAKNEEAERVLKKYGTVVHKKDVELSSSGVLEFIRLVYTGEWWTGSFIDDFKHSRGKALLAFPKNLPRRVRVYLYECDERSLTTKAKLEIRDLCNLGQESVHINDTHQQTTIIAKTVFNANSIKFINAREIGRCEAFEKQLNETLQSLIKEKRDLDEVYVDKEGAYAAYGKTPYEKIDLRFRESEPDSDEILFNPQRHFYYSGIKFRSF